MNANDLKKLIIQEIENYNKNQENLKSKDVKILLYNYNKYLNKIEIYNKQLKELETSSYIINTSIFNNDIKVQQSTIFKSELEKKEEMKDILKSKINKLIYITTKIKDALSIIQDEEYHIILTMKYFQKKSNNEICNNLNISESTLIRNHNKLIKELKSILFL
ncbi:DUF1492 domain-containing protein [Streptobacillus moniliformis]|uniref:DUF1492 domain-containing protein n=1 Tax=Streptobacillus moniliformis TaxID=34105 RepID=UPI0007E41BC7|nr:DUF1492 domain-containing protein [Streptobacillus moniliformis]